MPNIKVTPAKGLFQSAGTSTVPNGTLSGQLSVVRAISANATLTQADSGKIIELDQDGTYTITLPAAADVAGFYVRFVVTDAGSGTVTIETNGGASGIVGIASDPTTGINNVSDRQLTFAGTGAVGDYAFIYSNGTRYVVDAKSGATNGIVGNTP